MVTLTGLGQRIGAGMFEIVGGNVFLGLMCAMLTSLILGMGVSTTSNYIITSTVAAPILIKLGVPLLASHMFCFYFGIIADITPPVALGRLCRVSDRQGQPLQDRRKRRQAGDRRFSGTVYVCPQPQNDYD